MLEGMYITDLKIISSENGTVMHAIKKGDGGYIKFGEVYFSTIHKDAVKAWKMHKQMTLNLVVPIGEVLFCFFDLRKKSKTYKTSFKIILSQNPYFRLTVPPGIWFGFKGIASGLNIITNIADMIHDKNEVIHQEINQIKMNWDID